MSTVVRVDCILIIESLAVDKPRELFRILLVQTGVSVNQPRFTWLANFAKNFDDEKKKKKKKRAALTFKTTHGKSAFK